MKRMLSAAAVACLLATAGCGSDSPTSSTPPIPSYAGTWSGTYTITGCTQSGGMASVNICGAIGNTPSYSITLQQSGSSATGTFTLGTITFPSTGGTVSANGDLGLQATTINSGVTVIVTWALHNTGSAVSGTITQVWTSTTLSGQTNIAGTIATANHTAVFIPSAQAAGPMTLSDLAASVGGRQVGGDR